MFPINSTDRLIFVNINNSYDAFINNKRTSPYFRESLYDCTVKYWRISEKKAAMATHIIGCYKGKVVEVVKINSFNTIKSEEYFGRKVFEGIEEPNSQYMGFDIRDLYDSLANFIVKYWNY